MVWLRRPRTRVQGSRAGMMIGEAVLVPGATAPRTSWRRRRPPVREFAEATLRGDAGEACELALQFLARVGSRLGVFADLVQPAQSEVGDQWYRGRIGIDDEH